MGLENPMDERVNTYKVNPKSSFNAYGYAVILQMLLLGQIRLQNMIKNSLDIVCVICLYVY